MVRPPPPGTPQVDVHLTADNVIAVLHDEDVGRVTVDGTGLISTLTWAQARALTLKNQGGQIPSLMEVRAFVTQLQAALCARGSSLAAPTGDGCIRLLFAAGVVTVVALVVVVAPVCLGPLVVVEVRCALCARRHRACAVVRRCAIHPNCRGRRAVCLCAAGA
jgi:hypothetical protein